MTNFFLVERPHILKIISELYSMQTNYAETDDLTLFNQMKDDDHHAFSTLYDRYKRQLYKHAYQKMGNTEEVEDVIQDLFSSIWFNRKSIYIHTLFSTYLFTSLRNRIIDHYVKSQNQEKYEKLLDHYAHSLNDTDYRIREKLYNEQVKGLIAHFSEKSQEIFHMRIFEELDNGEIAAKLNISEKTVRNNMWMIMSYLRSKLTISAFILFFFGTI